LRGHIIECTYIGNIVYRKYCRHTLMWLPPPLLLYIALHIYIERVG